MVCEPPWAPTRVAARRLTPHARPPAPQSNDVCRLDPTIATDVLADLFFLVRDAPPHTPRAATRGMPHVQLAGTSACS